MSSMRSLTEIELRNLANQLESAHDLIAESYDYPLKDLIANLRHPDYKGGNIEESSNGHIKSYQLSFTSPPSTWRTLCGVWGYYQIEASTLRSTEFLSFINS